VGPRHGGGCRRCSDLRRRRGSREGWEREPRVAGGTRQGWEADDP